MKFTLVVAFLGACMTSLVAAAGLDATDLETRVLTGETTPKAAITEYCLGESVDKNQDAFCSCPDEALRLLEQRLNLRRMDAT
jgi:hypothetical protein